MKFHFYLYIILSLCLSLTSTKDVLAQLYINEVLAANNTTNHDIHFYNFSDWIEIYNDGPHSVNLEGYTITDDLSVPDKYRLNFSLSIKASGFGVIWADKENWYPHANFGLDSEGEFVALFDPDGILVDSFSFSRQEADVSYGRYPDGSSVFEYMPEPTCSKANKPGFSHADNRSGIVSFSQPGGFYQGSQYIELTTASSTAVIRFTIDGSWPDVGSEQYESPIRVSSSKVIRARSFEEGHLPGPLQTESYFINEESDLPVLSISTDPKYFFNSVIGIYVVGENGIRGNCIDSAVNFNQPWERAVNFEYYSEDGVNRVNQLVGAKIAGRCSRTRPMKPMAIISRDKYGNKGFGGYQFFNSKTLEGPKNLYLRNSGTEAYSSYLRDGFMQTLIMDQMDMDYQAYQPLALYINGKYWGIHNLREKMDEHYVESNYGIDPESIDLLEYNTIGVRDVHQGDWVLYDQFLDYVSNNDLSIPGNYEYVKSQMDVEEFMNIHIANIYFENEDWPNNNNKFWRERSPGGKWRWYMYDLDFGFGYQPKTGNSVDWFFNDREDSRIAHKLKDNPDFVSDFVQRAASHLNTTFQTDRVLNILDSLKGNIDREMYRHVERWGNPWSHDKWERNVDVMYDFARERTEIVVPQIMDEFDLEGTFDLELQNATPPRGKIEVAGVEVPSEFAGFYFKDVPLKLKAIPRPGYRFSYWSGDVVSQSEEIYLSADSDRSVTAHFEPAEAIENLYISEFLSGNAHILMDDHDEYDDWIEVYNDNDHPLDLAGLYMSDSAGDLTRYQIPFGDPDNTLIPAKAYKIFWADRDVHQGCMHLPFKLSKDGETIFLSQRTGGEVFIMDSISYGKQHNDISYGRNPQDAGQWIFMEPTPGKENQEKRFENIRINEFMASNHSVLQDGDGNWDDWIEIYNANDYAVDLAGMFISDDIHDPRKSCLPYGKSDSTTLGPGEYLILWADDSAEQGILHLDFALNGAGEQIVLTQGKGFEVVDSISYPDLIFDAPYGRTVDGAGSFTYMLATPGASNEQPDFSDLYINEIMASNGMSLEDGPGEYDDWIELYNAGDDPVNVGGLFLSDSLENRTMFRISTACPDSTTISPGGYLLIWADKSTKQGVLHADFKLDGAGEQLILRSSTADKIIDSLTYGKQHRGISYGLLPQKTENRIFLKPSPGKENQEKSFENIFINEFMASNSSVQKGGNGRSDDWIEVYNANDYPVDLAGMFISDDLQNPRKYPLPYGKSDSTTIGPRDYLIFWADNAAGQGILHLDFALDGAGEQIVLTQGNGFEVLDSVSYPDLIPDAPYGRTIDGGGYFSYMLASPGASNVQPDFSDLFINEIMASNGRTLEDGPGEYDDWIELYNGGDLALDVGGLFLSDSLENRTMFRISTAFPDSTTILPGDYLIIWADDSTEQGILHTNFKLRGSGEQLILSSTNAETILDSLSFARQHRDLSVGRVADGAEGISIQIPTPGTANLTFSYEGIRISEVMASDHSQVMDEHGEYEDWIELYNSSGEVLDLAGMVLSDSLDVTDPFFIPGGYPEQTRIKPGDYMVLWADNAPEQGPLHLGFGLRESGEQVGIFTMNGEVLDSLTYPNQYNNFSYSRLDEGQWMHVPPTPGEENLVELIKNLHINEFMADNENRLMDDFGEYEDWIEIYNANDFAVDLAGLYLSDTLSRKDRYRIPSNDPEQTIVPAGGFQIVWTDGESDQGPLHTNFKLSRSGEDLVLSGYDHRQIIDSTSFGWQYSNFSRGRLEESGSWQNLPPTPRESNVMPDLSPLCINEIMPLNMGFNADNHGEYDDWIELYNGGPEALEVGGLFISDSIGDPHPFRISSDYPDSTTLEPMQFLLIWADDSTSQGVLHCDFKLNRAGEAVALYAYDGKTLIDSVSYGLVPRYQSYGRRSEGFLPWVLSDSPTPLAYNMHTSGDDQPNEVLVFHHDIYPNPASEQVTILLEIAEATEVRMKVYDRAGKMQAMPLDGYFSPGRYRVPWTAENSSGSPLGSGIYFYIIETGTSRVSGKLLIIN